MVQGLNSDTGGYRGNALKTLRRAKVSVGNIIRVTTNGHVYEGTLFPRAEYGDDRHIVLKLKSGYNIGLEITDKLRLERVGPGDRPAYRSPPEPSVKAGLPGIAMISTGGTIASRVDYRTGSVLPTLSAEDLYHFVPELSKIAMVDAEILYTELSENLTPKHWREIALKIAEHISSGKDGIVIPHGTDTMGYTAAALGFALRDLPVPVVLVGSQRSSDRPSSDAASNLVAATTVAAQAPFAEVVIVMHEQSSDEYAAIHRGTKVRKCHTSRRDAFESVNTEPLGRVNMRSQQLEMKGDVWRKRDGSRKVNVKAEFDEKVALLKFYPNMDPRIIDWLIDQDYRGIVIEGSGLGHVSKACFESIGRAVESQVLVGMTSQCIWGTVNMSVYETGRDLLALGVLPLEDMLAETAYVKMMWALAQTKSIEEAKEVMATNVAGELNQRRVSWR